MSLTVVGQLRVNFVGNDDQVMPQNDLPQLFQLRPAQNAAGGVVGIGQDQRLRLGGDRLFQRLGGQHEVVGFAGGHGHRAAACEDHAGGVADIAGFWHQYLFAGVEQSPQRQINALAGPYRDQNFILGVIGNMETVVHIGGDLLPQFQKAPVAGVLGLAVQNAVDGRVADVVGRDEVRLANAQRDRAGDGGRHIEEFADAGFGHRRHALVQVTVRIETHAVTTSLLS